jgi:hypothetical protein
LTDKVHLAQIEVKELFARNISNILGANALDIGDVISVGGYSHISGYVYSDVASAAPGGVIIEQAASQADFATDAISTENVTVSTIAIAAGNIVDNSLAVQIVAPFARVIYVNGAAGQAAYKAYFAARIIRGL